MQAQNKTFFSKLTNVSFRFHAFFKKKAPPEAGLHMWGMDQPI
jgi:hypothetical protein